MRCTAWISALILGLTVGLVAAPTDSIDQTVKTMAVQSFDVDSRGTLTARTRDVGDVQFPDNAYDNGSGVVLVFSRGRIVSIEMRGTTAKVDSASKTGGKIILRGVDIAKISRTGEIEVPAGRYEPQHPNDPPDPGPQDPPQPQPTPQGFEIRDGKVTTILISPKTRPDRDLSSP